MNIPSLEENPQFWEEMAGERVIRFIYLTSIKNQCFMCKWSNGGELLNRFPKEVVPLFQLIKGDYLFHLQSTHGLAPELLSMILFQKDNG